MKGDIAVPVLGCALVCQMEQSSVCDWVPLKPTAVVANPDWECVGSVDGCCGLMARWPFQSKATLPSSPERMNVVLRAIANHTRSGCWRNVLQATQALLQPAWCWLRHCLTVFFISLYYSEPPLGVGWLFLYFLLKTILTMRLAINWSIRFSKWRHNNLFFQVDT